MGRGLKEGKSEGKRLVKRPHGHQAGDDWTKVRHGRDRLVWIFSYNYSRVIMLHTRTKLQFLRLLCPSCDVMCGIE